MAELTDINDWKTRQRTEHLGKHIVRTRQISLKDSEGYLKIHFLSAHQMIRS
jgi:hypothetical protein